MQETCLASAHFSILDHANELEFRIERREKKVHCQCDMRVHNFTVNVSVLNKREKKESCTPYNWYGVLLMMRFLLLFRCLSCFFFFLFCSSAVQCIERNLYRPNQTNGPLLPCFICNNRSKRYVILRMFTVDPSTNKWTKREIVQKAKRKK